MPISESIQAPEFTLPDETGRLHSLKDYLGKPLILYFYPKDDTPGCTTEACAFRDNYSAYIKAGVTILGISADSPKSHAKFKEKYGLPFSLLSDEDHKVCELYGTWGPKKMYGRIFPGILRTTFVIGADGKILKVFENVKPAGHAEEVLGALPGK